MVLHYDPLKLRSSKVGLPTDSTAAPRASFQSKGWKRMGPLVANTRAHERHGHPDPHLNLDRAWSIVLDDKSKSLHEIARLVVMLNFNIKNVPLTTI
jgi:hypothetical protein